MVGVFAVVLDCSFSATAGVIVGHSRRTSGIRIIAVVFCPREINLSETIVEFGDFPAQLLPIRQGQGPTIATAQKQGSNVDLVCEHRVQSTPCDYKRPETYQLLVTLRNISSAAQMSPSSCRGRGSSFWIVMRLRKQLGPLSTGRPA